MENLSSTKPVPDASWGPLTYRVKSKTLKMFGGFFMMPHFPGFPDESSVLWRSTGSDLKKKGTIANPKPGNFSK